MLENKRIGFIGGGMMAEALARGLLKAGVDASRISVSDPSEARRGLFQKDLGVAATEDNAAVAQSAEMIVIATKPFVVGDALATIAGAVRPQQLIISIAAGVTTEFIQSKLPEGMPVVRVMPNTPALIGEGAAGIAPGRNATQTHLDLATEIFSASGKAVQLTEDKLDAVTGLSGSGPAFVYTFIEALADGGVRMGIPKATALTLAAQTVVGSARMVLEAGEHPAVLRDKVMTPGGTTIAGMASLERDKFRSACIEAVTAATNRSAELGKPKT